MLFATIRQTIQNLTQYSIVCFSCCSALGCSGGFVDSRAHDAEAGQKRFYADCSPAIRSSLACSSILHRTWLPGRLSSSLRFLCRYHPSLGTGLCKYSYLHIKSTLQKRWNYIYIFCFGQNGNKVFWLLLKNSFIGFSNLII